MMNRKRTFLPMLHSFFIFLILVLLFPNLAYSFPADFDGDGKNDFVVWRQPEAVWYVWPSTYSVSHSCPPHFQQIGGPGVYLGCKAQWGLPGDMVLSGNYDNDALADLVIWRPSTQTWWIKFSSYDGVVGVQFGLPNDIPDEVNAEVTDAVSDLVVFRPSTFTWYIRSSIPPYAIRSYVGGRALAGRVDPIYMASAIYDPQFTGTPNGPAYFSNAIGNNSSSYGVWSIVLMETNPPNYYEPSVFPNTSTTTSFIPVIGNFGGQSLNKADYVIWDKNNGNWSIKYNGGTPSGITTIQWGLPGDLPLGGDYDGDGITDLTVWRGASSGGWAGTWFVKPSSHICPAYMTPYGSGGCSKQWGLPGDIPVS